MTLVKPFGPVSTTVQKAQATLDELWSRTNVETRAYTGNIVALTTREHLRRVEEALTGLEGRYAGRQIIGLMDGKDDLKVHASLVPQGRGLYVERLVLDANEAQLQGAVLPLLRSATVNHVWWGSDARPTGVLLKELTEVADQLIVDSLSLDIPPGRHYALADLSWSRSANWREALAQIFDTPEAARQLRHVREMTVRHAGRNDLPARLFAGFVGDALKWRNLNHVEFRAGKCSREGGDLCGIELTGEGVRFALTAQEGEMVRVEAVFSGCDRVTEMHVPSMTLADGLGRVMAHPERGEVFEHAWKLAKASLDR